MENSVDTVIGINVSLKGNLLNKGSVEINGMVEGEVKSDENVIIGETAVIKGPVCAKKIEVSGEIRGLVQANEKLEINSTGKIYGDINAKTLIIKEGAVFVGKSTMPAETTPQPIATIQAEKPAEKKEEKDNTDKLGFFSKK